MLIPKIVILFIIIAVFMFTTYYSNTLQYSSKKILEGMGSHTMSGNISSDSDTISKSQIPKGNEDLYILKSNVIPPVCPKCPDVIQTCPKKECQPCPPCGRCPEPAFECKKVPNYSVINDVSTIRPNLVNPKMF